MKNALLALLMLSPLTACAEEVRPVVGSMRGEVVAAGETLYEVAYRNRLAIDHLTFANGLPTNTVGVPAGTRVVIPSARILPAHPPRNGLIINLPERGAYLFREGRYQGFYPVSIGDEVLRKGRFFTPTGSYKIIEKQKNPTWYPPAWAADRRPVGPGPRNPLGDRWIGLSLPRTGIHGTNDPLNVGNSVTHGCMRTYPALVHELYDKVRVGDVARIEYETSKVGRDAAGKFYAVTFPDVYRRTDPTTELGKKLRCLHLERWVARDNFVNVMQLGLGFPVRIDARSTVAEELASSISWSVAASPEE